MYFLNVITITLMSYTIRQLEGYNITTCKAMNLTNATNNTGFRFDCKADKPTQYCKISEILQDYTERYCYFEKSYIDNDEVRGFNLVKSYCSGKKDHDFLLRIGHGEILEENRCVLEVTHINRLGIMFDNFFQNMLGY